jgi:hypothetical protein
MSSRQPGAADPAASAGRFRRRPAGRLLAALMSLALASAVVASARSARADDGAGDDDEHGPFFYKGYDYGSQALYNPAWVLVNRGFDVVQLRTNRRAIFSNAYATDARNVGENVLLHPTASVSDEGWGQFLREEVLPLSYTRQTARWIPNYTLHLIGGGVTYTALREWSRAKGLEEPYAAMLSAGTLLSAAFINESFENGGVVGRNTDAIADWWFFDIGGIVLFSFDPVNRFFSRTLIVSDWSLQPSMTFPRGELHDQGNYFAAKLPIPFYERLRLFGYYGLGTLGGLSWQLDRHYSVSAAVGSKVTRLLNTESGSVENTIQFARSGALFLDRNESLLASVQVSDVRDYFVQLNVYPNAIVRTDPGIGLWTVVGRTGEVAWGLSITRALGLGVGYSRF